VLNFCTTLLKLSLQKRHQADSETNNREVEVLKNGYWQWVKWRDVAVGDFVKIKNDTFFPADLILYSSR
jgi:phospholipid-transporting ATPase